jgi:phosphatidylethanolamine-binding protein (PEBP) family uncharacterized protein
MSYAVTLNHDAPDNSAHWAIWDIPPDVTSLPANIEHAAMPMAPAPTGTKQSRVVGLDMFTGYGYLGPCPQMNNATQNYKFTVYAMTVRTLPGVAANVMTADAQRAIIAGAIPGNAARATLTGNQIRTP